MGSDLKNIMNSLPGLSTEDKKDPDKIIQELRKHFILQRNVRYERFVFDSVAQKTGETVDEFIVRLRQQAEPCEFGALKDSLIRDRIVIGTSDESGRERLLRERPVPDLARVVVSLRAAEISRSNKQVISGKPEPEHIHHNRGRNNRAKKRGAPRGPGNKGSDQQTGSGSSAFGKSTQPPENQQQTPRCRWCGRQAVRLRKDCPAKNIQCHNCQKIGHFATVCQSAKQVHEVDGHDDSNLDTFYMMGEVNSISENFWSVELLVDENACDFKLDSGSKVTVVSDQTPWIKGMQLEEVKTEFRGPGGVKLSHLMKGQITNATFQAGDKAHHENVYVMSNQRNNLLSKSAIQALRLLVPAPKVNNMEKLPNFREEFPKLFKGLGMMKEPYKIPLKEDAVPVCLYTPRRIPHPLLPKVKQKLEGMVAQGVISPVTTPTDWCSGIVNAPKRNEDVRICVDLTSLNRAVKREFHPMASVDENLPKLKDRQIFSKLDANSGFWQIPLDDECKLLATFVTPYGRFCFNRLPFGISSAPEVFQRTMSMTLEGLEGIVCHMDDILIHGPTQEVHDERVRLVLERPLKAGITLNDKCEFSKQKIKYLGHIISEKEVETDPEKNKAIQDFPRPNTVKELQRFNGMVNQLAKFLPDLAKINEPLRQLLRKEQQWLWDQPQERAFQEIKKKLTSTEVLEHYDPGKRSIVAADACQDGLGAVLMQIDDLGNRRPIAYASRSLTDAEKRYAVIEKEALAATWGCDKFSDYILGTTFSLETDHRPLVPLLASTDLTKLPPRILRFRLRMARYAPDVKYVQGVHQNRADALSRAPTSKLTLEDLKLVAEVEEQSGSVLKSMPATEQRLEEIKAAQDSDAICKQVKSYCQDGWPLIMPSKPLLTPYWEKKQHMTVTNGLPMFNDRIVIPMSLQLQMLDAIHEGHLGVTKCQGRASYSVWWPLITKQIEAMVNKCHICAKLRPETREPLMALSFPEKPWTRLGTDLFELDRKTYIIVVDYTSRWFEVKELRSISSSAVIKVLQELFATHGIPQVIMSDNSPQYASHEFSAFAREWGFNHATSLPNYPQANGEVERAVQTAKNILKKNADLHLGLLAYRSAPLRNGLTPSEILINRKLRTRLPAPPEAMQPTDIDKEKMKAKEEAYREAYTRSYNLGTGLYHSLPWRKEIKCTSETKEDLEKYKRG
ncbi:uncharacterized protein K02A2.6-like [Nematostella vectensis]|uniref:uncharacterized protein K02A2.6-like n=1 Tax=Nematostella vectensis TaxID=45351 RepID=UPI002077168C|nr:uncharacterized protein K02A2.6-like [Nematostella vectensis]